MEELINNFIGDNKTEILFIGDIEDYRKRMSTNFIKFIDYLKSNIQGFRVVYYGSGIDGYNKGYSLLDVVERYCENKDPIVWICDVKGTETVRDRGSYKGNKILDIEDIYNKIEIFHKELDSINYDYVLYKNDCYDIYKLKKKFNKPTYIRYDHYIDDKVFKDYQLEKDYDILCYGCTDMRFYPFRNRLFKLFIDDKNFNTCYLGHPGYGYSRFHNIVEDELSKLINRSKITIVTPSVLNFLLKKYTETALSGSCMLGKLPLYNGENYERCLIEIDENMTDEEIITKVRYYLDNDVLREEIVEKARKVALDNYVYDKGVEKFSNIFKGIVDKNIIEKEDKYGFEKMYIIDSYVKNQLVDISYDKEHIRVTSLKNNSTPGIKKLFDLSRYHRYTIYISGFKECISNVRVWIGDADNNTILFDKKYELSEDNSDIVIEYMNGNRNKIYIGVLFINGISVGDSFYMKDIKISPFYIENENSKRKITFLTFMDYANVFTEWSNTINNLSDMYESKVICISEHVYNYKMKHNYNLDKVKDDEDYIRIMDWINSSKYIVYGYEDNVDMYKRYIDFDIYSYSNRYTRIIYHTGSNYRGNYKFINESINPMFDKCIYAPDLYRLSNKNENDYVFFPIISREISNNIDNKFNREKLLILHSPSNIENKGTRKVENVLKRLFENNSIVDRFEYRIMYPPQSNEEVLKNMDTSIIYIDQLSDNVGTFGVSSIEALKSNNVVYTSRNNIDSEYWEKVNIEKDDLPIINIENEEDLYNKLVDVCGKENDEIRKMIIDGRNAYKNTISGDKFYELFEKNILS